MSIYYFEITPKIETYEVEAGSIIKMDAIPGRSTKISRLASYSDRVWVQESSGRLCLMKDISTGRELYSVFNIPNDDELAKEFMWVKLKAKEIAGYA